MSQWGWTPERNLGIWRYGVGWIRPIMAAIPYLTVGVLILQLHLVGGTLSTGEGVLFDLPSSEAGEDCRTDLVALVMPLGHDRVVFFDESRYLLDDSVSMSGFYDNLRETAQLGRNQSILLLVDRRISTGDLMSVVSMVRQCGIRQVLLAGKRAGAEE